MTVLAQSGAVACMLVWMVATAAANADVNLSGAMTGVELAHAATKDYPNIHVVVASGKALPQELPVQALFMQKPWLTLDLLREAERSQIAR